MKTIFLKFIPFNPTLSFLAFVIFNTVYTKLHVRPPKILPQSDAASTEQYSVKQGSESKMNEENLGKT